MDASITNNDEFGSHHEGAKEKEKEAPADGGQQAAPDGGSDRGQAKKKVPPVKDDLARKRALVASQKA